MPIYKYLPSKYVDEFMEQGKILFRSLTYFIEEYNEQADDPVRRDENEGQVQYTVPEDAKLFVDDEEISYIPGTLVANEKLINSETYFIFCCSNKFDKNLCKEFKTEACIEIFDIDAFSNRLQKSINIATLKQGEITYYKKAIDKAEKDLLLYKDSYYEGQSEYRFYFRANYSERPEKYHWSAKTESGLNLLGRITHAVAYVGPLNDIAKVNSS